jgi:hypothetical protein
MVEIQLRIEYTAHAEQRALQRQIGKDDIERILKSPSEEIYDDYEENYQCYGKEPREVDKYIKIVYRKLNNNTLKVITVMINDIGDLRKSGFSDL